MSETEGFLLPYDFPENGAIPPHDQRLRIALYQAFNGMCFYTCQPINLADMQVDHVVPRALGGPDNVYNYAPTSSQTNRDKSAAFDQSAVIPVLYLIRTSYAPRVLQLLEASDLLPKPVKNPATHPTRRSDKNSTPIFHIMTDEEIEQEVGLFQYVTDVMNNTGIVARAEPNKVYDFSCFVRRTTPH